MAPRTLGSASRTLASGSAQALPVAPGRNIASLVEVGARNHVLRSRGKSGAEELDARVFAVLRGEGS